MSRSTSKSTSTRSTEPTASEGPEIGTNVTVLVGVLSRDAELRTLPSGDHVVALEVTVPSDVGPAESVPVSWPDAPATAAAWEKGEALLVTGRVRRRYFRAGGVTQSRTEVVAARVVPTRRRAAAGKALAAAIGTLPGRL
jgi:single-strand DNA-binding protein